MTFWQFEIFEKCPGPMFKIPAKKLCLNKIRSGSNSQNPNLHFQPFIKLFDIYGNMDLEKLIWTNPSWEFITETFDLLWAKPFENLVFSTLIPRGQIPRFPDAAGRTLKSRSRPRSSHPGMKYFRKGNPRCCPITPPRVDRNKHQGK